VSPDAGTGPGEITGDGCAVELYALLPPLGEAGIVHAAVPKGASILELGCGTGRILRPLASLGHRVHGVDDSLGMLAHLTGLPVTCSPIESLRLNERFDVVLLASTLLNAGPAQRRAFLATCRHHLPDHGTAMFQYHPPAWFEAFPDTPREGELGEIAVIIRACSRVPSGITCEVEYRAAGQTWTHAWTSYKISDTELTADLAAAGLALGRWLTEDHTWFTAGPLGSKCTNRETACPERSAVTSSCPVSSKSALSQ
jgi:SAM-dependent methyltransferase